jgi:plastocyanin
LRNACNVITTHQTPPAAGLFPVSKKLRLRNFRAPRQVYTAMTNTRPNNRNGKASFTTTIAAFVALVGAGCQYRVATAASSQAAPTAPTTQQVTIDNFSFTPATLVVPVGGTVRWTNHDDVPHTVTASDKGFTSKALDTDDAYSHTFTKPGTYSYFCAVHPHMTGEIVVK